MRFTPTSLAGLVVVDSTPIADDRGHFARSFCADAFAAAGLPSTFPQCNFSFNQRCGTLRGLHWQAEPHPEGKLVRCTQGAVFDVAVDIRPASATFRQWFGLELSAGNGRALYIPPGFAHGFQALRDGSEVFYMMTESYHPALARGAAWDDPGFGIAWPLAAPIMSDRDRALPRFTGP
jgi:dTDP-4-dehydrorhamnose 3,5-epimerase